MIYAAGIGAIVGDAYENLFRIFYTPVPNPYGDKNGEILVTAVTRPMREIYDAFKWFPEHKNNYVPRSEYLYRLLQPSADDALFLGGEYDLVFDRFELLYSLEYIHLDHPLSLEENEQVWGPIGRFGWKGRGERTPLQILVEEAKREGGHMGSTKGRLF